MNLDFLTNYGQKSKPERDGILLKKKQESEKNNQRALKNCISFLKIRGVKIEINKLREKSREPRVVFLRAAVSITLNHYGVAKSDIGRILNIDHSTVIFSLKYGDKKTHKPYLKKLDEIKFALHNSTGKVLKEIEKYQKMIDKLEKSIRIKNA